METCLRVRNQDRSLGGRVVHLLLRVIMDGDGMGGSLPGDNEPLVVLDIVIVEGLAGSLGDMCSH